MMVDSSMVSWVTDYMRNKAPFVSLGTALFDAVVSNMGALQGTVLSPFLDNRDHPLHLLLDRQQSCFQTNAACFHKDKKSFLPTAIALLNTLV